MTLDTQEMVANTVAVASFIASGTTMFFVIWRQLHSKTDKPDDHKGKIS